MPLSAADKIAVLEAALNIGPLDSTTGLSAQLGLPKDDVLTTLRTHGYPNRGRMQTAIEMLLQQVDDPDTDDASPALPPVRHEPPSPAASAPEVLSAADAPAGIEQLLAQAQASGQRALIKKAQRLTDLVAELETALAEDAEAATKRRRIAELEAELDELRKDPAVKRTRAAATCEHCGRTFAGVQALRGHERARHSEAS